MHIFAPGLIILADVIGIVIHAYMIMPHACGVHDIPSMKVLKEHW
jgi:hypothetical protein